VLGGASDPVLAAGGASATAEADMGKTPSCLWLLHAKHFLAELNARQGCVKEVAEVAGRTGGLSSWESGFRGASSLPGLVHSAAQAVTCARQCFTVKHCSLAGGRRQSPSCCEYALWLPIAGFWFAVRMPVF